MLVASTDAIVVLLSVPMEPFDNDLIWLYLMDVAAAHGFPEFLAVAPLFLSLVLSIGCLCHAFFSPPRRPE